MPFCWFHSVSFMCSPFLGRSPIRPELDDVVNNGCCVLHVTCPDGSNSWSRSAGAFKPQRFGKNGWKMLGLFSQIRLIFVWQWKKNETTNQLIHANTANTCRYRAFGYFPTFSILILACCTTPSTSLAMSIVLVAAITENQLKPDLPKLSLFSLVQTFGRNLNTKNWFLAPNRLTFGGLLESS